MAESLVLAAIAGVHGVKGWVKLKVFLEDPNLMTQLPHVRLVPSERSGSGQPRSVEIEAVRQRGKAVVASIKGIDDRTSAEALRGWVLEADKSSFPEAGAGEYYWHELMGLDVWCREGDAEPVYIGKVDHMLETGANDVMVVKAAEDSIDEQERLIPWLEGDVVTAVDLEQARVDVNWYLEV